MHRCVARINFFPRFPLRRGLRKAERSIRIRTSGQEGEKYDTLVFEICDVTSTPPIRPPLSNRVQPCIRMSCRLSSAESCDASRLAVCWFWFQVFARCFCYSGELSTGASPPSKSEFVLKYVGTFCLDLWMKMSLDLPLKIKRLFKRVATC